MTDNTPDKYARCVCGLILHSRIEWGQSPNGGAPIPVKTTAFCVKCGDFVPHKTDVSGGTRQPEADNIGDTFTAHKRGDLFENRTDL